MRWSRQRGLPAVIVNPSTPIGPRDVKPTPTGRMIVEAASGRMPAFVDTGLNLVHVDDVAEGHLLAEERGRIGERYILGGENLALARDPAPHRRDRRAQAADRAAADRARSGRWRSPPRRSAASPAASPSSRSTGCAWRGRRCSSPPPRPSAQLGYTRAPRQRRRSPTPSPGSARRGCAHERLGARHRRAVARDLALSAARPRLLLDRAVAGRAAPRRARWPSVVAVVPARNEAAVVGAAVASLLAQDYPGRFLDRAGRRSQQRRHGRDRARGGGERRRGERLTTSRRAPCRRAGPASSGRSRRRAARRERGDAPDLLLFTDADIAHHRTQSRRAGRAARRRNGAISSR